MWLILVRFSKVLYLKLLSIDNLHYLVYAASLSDIFRDSAQIGQNADELQKADLNVQGVDDDVVHIPDFAFEQWIDRYDVTFRIGRMIRRTFGIRDLASVGSVEIITEKGKV